MPPAPAPDAAAVAAPTAPSLGKKLRLPLIIGGAVVIVLVIVAVILVAVLGGSRGPAQAANDLIRAVQTGDCKLYVAVTTENFRGGSVSADDCEKAGGFSAGNTINYTFVISSTDISGSTATVKGTLTVSDKTDPTTQPITSPVTFTVIQEGGTWKVDSTQ
ncbi:MAG: nuclear transport factor 2 family protein [Pseudolysinimonas sp.]|uniref:nuclear transport factor 2 family protein n=1 Tax=Pseudolysinimonas sp. TaxID=2680009 RepID=UPI003267A436